MTITIDYAYDPLGRLISADYSSGEFPDVARTGFHFKYPAKNVRGERRSRRQSRLTPLAG